MLGISEIPKMARTSPYKDDPAYCSSIRFDRTNGERHQERLFFAFGFFFAVFNKALLDAAGAPNTSIVPSP